MNYIFILIIIISIVVISLLYFRRNTSAIIFSPDLPIEKQQHLNIPNIRSDVYLKSINDNNIYVSLIDYKLILSNNKIPVTLHQYNPQMLLKEYGNIFRKYNNDDDETIIRKRELDKISFVIINGILFELDPMGKGYILKKRIHMCGDYGVVKYNNGALTYNHSDTDIVFRLENDRGEFVLV